MLIEDNPDLSEMSCRVLEMHGFFVIPAFTGKQAIKVLETVTADLILLDLTLPDMGPLDFRKAFDASTAPKDIPLVVLSGRDDSKQWATEIRADGHISKPYEFEKLVELINRLIDRSHEGAS